LSEAWNITKNKFPEEEVKQNKYARICVCVCK